VVAGGGRAESVELGADMRTQYFVVVELIVGRDNKWQLVGVLLSADWSQLKFGQDNGPQEDLQQWGSVYRRLGRTRKPRTRKRILKEMNVSIIQL